jgi:hypothetical protein
MSEKNSIEIVTSFFEAGDSRLFAFSGEYFEVIDAVNPIDIVLSDFNGAQKARMSQATASFYSRGVEYGVIQITSASAQTVRFAYGSGETGTRRSTGSVTISGPVALDGATLAALENTTVSVSGPVQIRPEAPTGSSSGVGYLQQQTPVTIFTPGENANGAIILNADIRWQSVIGTIHCASFLSKSNLPLTPLDGSVILIANTTQYFSSSLCFGSASLSIPQFIPAGQGLYFIDIYEEDGIWGNSRSCRYKLL